MPTEPTPSAIAMFGRANGDLVRKRSLAAAYWMQVA